MIFSSTPKWKGARRKFVEQVLCCLREHQWYGKLSKCSLFQKKIHYLGHIIFGEGTSVDPEKVKAIMDWPISKNVHEVRSFMGLAIYYWRFVKGFSKIAKPITTLQHKGVRYECIDECQMAFSELKRLLISAPILWVTDMDKYFTICKWCIKAMIRCNINARQRSNNVCLNEIKASWKTLHQTRFRVSCCSTNFKDVETLSCREKFYAQRQPPEFAILIYLKRFECETKTMEWILKWVWHWNFIH